jgi:hypothetical protein
VFLGARGFGCGAGKVRGGVIEEMLRGAGYVRWIGKTEEMTKNRDLGRRGKRNDKAPLYRFAALTDISPGGGEQKNKREGAEEKDFALVV